MRRLIPCAFAAGLAACGAPSVRGPALPQCPAPTPGETTVLQIPPQQFADPRGEIAPIVADDLRRTGRVKVLASSDTGAAKPAYVMTGAFDDDVVEVRLVDPLHGCQLLAQAFEVERYTPVRYVAHQVADAIHEKLFGVPGAANSVIAYVENDEPGTRIVVSDADGEAATVVASSKEALMAPTWSPDYKLLAFVGLQGAAHALFVQDVSSGSVDKIAAEPGLDPYVGWIGRSQVAFGLAVDGNLDIYSEPADGGKRTRLTDDPHADSEPDAPADGHLLSFTSDRSGTRQVHVLDLRTHELRQVTSGPAEHFHARFSPDGSRLAVVAKDESGTRIELVDLASGKVQPLSEGPHDDWPSFAPNGLSIAYTAKETGGTTYIVVATTNGRAKQNMRGANPRQPAFSRFMGAS